MPAESMRGCLSTKVSSIHGFKKPATHWPCLRTICFRGRKDARFVERASPELVMWRLACSGHPTPHVLFLSSLVPCLPGFTCSGRIAGYHRRTLWMPHSPALLHRRHIHSVSSCLRVPFFRRGTPRFHSHSHVLGRIFRPSSIGNSLRRVNKTGLLRLRPFPRC